MIGWDRLWWWGMDVDPMQLMFFNDFLQIRGLNPKGPLHSCFFEWLTNRDLAKTLFKISYLSWIYCAVALLKRRCGRFWGAAQLMQFFGVLWISHTWKVGKMMVLFPLLFSADFPSLPMIFARTQPLSCCWRLSSRRLLMSFRIAWMGWFRWISPVFYPGFIQSWGLLYMEHMGKPMRTMVIYGELGQRDVLGKEGCFAWREAWWQCVDSQLGIIILVTAVSIVLHSDHHN